MGYKLEQPFTDEEKTTFIVQHQFIDILTIEEHEDAIYALADNEMVADGKIIINPNYEKEKADERQKEFLEKFFKVTLPQQFTEKEYVYYRKIPKGYASAIESITTAERICAKMQGLPANTLIFYEEPNFYDETQCTEEWLSQHQIVLPALTIEQFDYIFINFIQSWNVQEHTN